MPMRPLWAFASAVTSALLLGSGCSSEEPRLQDGPLGQTTAALSLTTPGFMEVTVFQGLTEPTVVRFASDGRAFVAEKSGKIWIYDSLTDTTPTLFTDLANRVHDFWDRGMLGMTLDPAFPTQPYVYVLYAYDGDPGGGAPTWGDQCPTPPGATADGCVISGRLSRFTATGNAAGAEKVLLEGWRQQYPSHSTGQVEFGPDGALYASGGDGASFNFVDYGQDGNPRNPLGDPPVAVGQAQTPPTAEGGALRSQSVRRAAGPVLLNGTVIRVDPATGAASPGNPMQGSTDSIAKRVIAYGLRNPFRIAARPGTNELWVADVGWNDWEEVNRIPLGGASALNFGWPCYEGSSKQPGYQGAGLAQCESLYAGGGHSAPFFAYNHNAGVSSNDACGRGSSSITGLAFYSGSSYPPAYQGAMFFADYSRRCIYVMEQGQDGEPAPATARSFHVDADGPVFLTTGPGGDLFYAALTSGTIQRISYLQPAAVFKASPVKGQAPLLVNFDGGASTKALPGDVLTYAWDLDGDGAFDDATEVKPAYLYETIGKYAPRLKVTDQRGVSNVSQPLVVDVTAEPPPVSTPPDVFIDTPLVSTRWKVGDAIAFSGHAVDAEDGNLPASALSWQIVIQHCPSGCHVHDLLSFEGVASGTFPAEDHEYPMRLELILTATDESGQTRTVRRELQPQTVSLVFDTEPSGLTLVVGSTAQQTPFTRRVIVGSENTVSAAQRQDLSGASWTFAQWSDGLPRAHTLADATQPTRYVATYAPGGGLTAQYFDQLAFGGTPLTRLDPIVDFDWGNGSPDPSIGADTFSARWTGEVKADFSETYTFRTTSDDGVRLSIDGVAVIDHFDDHAAAIDNGAIALTPGWHDVALEYYEQGGGAQLTLGWSSPSRPYQVIPDTHLRPGCAASVCSAGQVCGAGELCTPACVPAACASKHCQAGAGVCVELCSGLTCPAGDKCVTGGLCVDACTGISCDAAQHCEAGACVDDPPDGGGGAGGQTGAGGESGNGSESGGSTSTGGTPSNGGAPHGGGSDHGGGASSGAPADGGAPTEGGALTGGSAGAGESGGGASPSAAAGAGEEPSSSGSGGKTASPSGGSTGEPASGSGSSGCSCRTVGTTRSDGYGWLTLAGALALSRRRKRAEVSR
ncbi:MAG: hypothetical protein EOO73_20790 [Myxococcales bacterium]|nr:MAG: hypothetical protein EOO73_20790 [Myxococcales bacterium]